MKKFFTSIAMICLCLTTAMAQVVYTTNFGTEDEFKTWTVFDVNEDGKTWNFDSSASPSYVFYSYHGSNAANDWIISPAITPSESGALAIKFKVKGSSYGEKMQVFLWKISNSRGYDY